MVIKAHILVDPLHDSITPALHYSIWPKMKSGNLQIPDDVAADEKRRVLPTDRNEIQRLLIDGQVSNLFDGFVVESTDHRCVES